MTESPSQQVMKAFDYLLQNLPSNLCNPAVGIICGSGLSGIAQTVLPEPRFEVSYADIPNFPQSTGIKRPCTL